MILRNRLQIPEVNRPRIGHVCAAWQLDAGEREGPRRPNGEPARVWSTDWARASLGNRVRGWFETAVYPETTRPSPEWVERASRGRNWVLTGPESMRSSRLTHDRSYRRPRGIAGAFWFLGSDGLIATGRGRKGARKVPLGWGYPTPGRQPALFAALLVLKPNLKVRWQHQRQHLHHNRNPLRFSCVLCCAADE